uniref:RxLR effector candidate protein n=1 Tax=Hyaloperonospora arabidopsidis (strain Emoy2) TaxID=559515 RepID=M4BRL3_HYAAE
MAVPCLLHACWSWTATVCSRTSGTTASFLLSICISELGELANILHCVAQCTYATTQGCMTAQVNVELREREKVFEVVDETMDRV